MDSIKIPLKGASGKTKYWQVVYEWPEACGHVHRFRGETREGCPDGEGTPGGRSSDTYHIPDGFEMEMLTNPERWQAALYLEERGTEPDRFIKPASVHGAWKIRRHQGAVLVRRVETAIK